MANCNCKTKTEDSIESISENKTNTKDNLIKYFTKSVGFLFSILLLPIINIMIIKFLFQTIVLNNKVDLRETLQYYFKNKKINDEDYENYLDLKEDEVEMLNVEEI